MSDYMSIDETGWIDLNRRLDATGWTSAQRDELVAYVTATLVGHFGADVIECPFGKNDPARHAMREVAAAAVAHLAPVIDTTQTDSLPQPPAPPWDDRWRDDPRTASWRS